MYLLIPSLPLIGSIAAGFFGRYIGRPGAKLVTTGLVGISALCSWIAFYEVGLSGSPVYIDIVSWIDSEFFNIRWGFLFDSLTVTMCVVITTISFFVHMYSTEYMDGDPHLPRFMSYLSFFSFTMLMLVIADNLMVLFLGWETVGVSSYLLISFWNTRIQANKSAVKAMIMNRIGDMGLALGIFGCFVTFGSVDYATIFATAPYFVNSTFTFFTFEVPTLDFICILLFVGAMGKSAMFLLHCWLPDAMEGPTPVSSLLHSATMVTAGVFLVARCSPLFEYAPIALIVTTVLGAATAFFAATAGLVQNDLKKIIAQSTASQLGYMMFICGLSAYSVGIFHLVTHASFKACLFLSSGSVIHAVADEQDVRKMGGLVRALPLTYAAMFIASLALMGAPFLSGFYSKDVILETAYAHYTLSGHFAHWLGTGAAFCTAFYSLRLLYLTFLAEPNGHKRIFEGVHDAPVLMALPLVVLAMGSIFLGYVSRDLFIGVGTDFWGTSLFTHPSHLVMLEAEFIPAYVKLTPVVFSFAGAISAFMLYRTSSEMLYRWKMNPYGRSIYTFLNKKWFFDRIYNQEINQRVLSFGYHTSYKLLDRGMFELLGPQGLSQTVLSLGKGMSRLQTGYLYHYAFVMMTGVTLLIAVVGLWDMVEAFVDPRLFFVFLVMILLSVSKSNKRAS